MFTPRDKIAKLQRLMKQIDEWNSQRDLPAFFRGGKPLIASEEFQEWRDKVTATVALIFGEYSHYIDDFNEIAYTDFWDHMSRIAGKEETKIWRGLEEARSMLQAMIDEIMESEEAAVGKSRERTSAIQQSVFIGHGRSPLWARLQLYLQNELGLRVINF